ncbi:MAG: hypothetical protein CVU93_02745 [Firmicutes bacterium HGW-Firmicutes-18]|nr:MAG: hypothetical protein CVU93_02745 [Firmicutes bacterium HGW-Firmicutes-18]
MKKLCILLTIGIIIIGTMTGCNTLTAAQRHAIENDRYVLRDSDSYRFTFRQSKRSPDGFDMSFRLFYGVYTLYDLDIKDNESVVIDFESVETSGQFKTVIVTPENEILTIAEGNDKGKVSLDLTEGKYKIKIVGKDAQGSLAINLAY